MTPTSPSRDQSNQRSGQLTHLLAGRWTLLVLGQLAERGRRYQDIHDALDGIAHKVLTDTLRRAERDGVITRHLDAEHIATATLYGLTGLGRSLDEPLAAFDRWVEANWQRVESARRDWDRRAGRD